MHKIYFSISIICDDMVKKVFFTDFDYYNLVIFKIQKRSETKTHKIKLQDIKIMMVEHLLK